MIPLAGLVLGILLGIRAAKKRSGNRLDLVQYGAAYGMAFALLGVILALVVERLAG